MCKHEPSEQQIGSGLTTIITDLLARFLRYIPLLHYEDGKKCHDN